MGRLKRVAGRVFVFALLAGLFCQPAAAVVINEVMYHSEELDDRPLEWIEIFNEKIDPFDLSGYSICNGIDFTFPAGTFLDGYQFVIIASDPDEFRAKYPDVESPVFGPWTGSLANNGERIEFCNVGRRTFQDVRYNDRGEWAVAADGTGQSLALVTPYSDIGDADNWRASLEKGGTPGAPNGFSIISGGGGTLGGNNMDGSGFINSWIILGAFQGFPDCNSGNAILEADWLRGTTTPRETDLIWRPDENVNTNFGAAQSTGLLGGGTPRTRSHRGALVNFDGAFAAQGVTDNVMAYAFVYIDNVTGSNLPVTFGASSDDAIQVMLNGADIHTNDACRGAGLEVQDRFDGTLEPGKNLITVKIFENGGGWGFAFRVEERGNGNPITSPAVIQVTTDVDAGLDFDGNGDPIIDIVDPEPEPEDPPLPGISPVVINEGFLRTDGTRWIELYNRTGSAIDLSDYTLTDDPSDLSKVGIANGTTIPGHGFLSFTEAELGFDFEITELRNRVFVGLVDEDGIVVDAYNFEPRFDDFSEVRFPDGDSEFDDGGDPTRDAANSITVNTDIVINEVMYHPIDNNREKEYIELYNRGESSVDLTGWKFSSGVNFDFPAGTSISSGAYLVVANNPDLIEEVYSLPGSRVIGPAQDAMSISDFGSLRDSGERVTLKDEMDRTVDSFRYHDGGEWPRWADGHGSSMELIDPLQDNRFGAAWDASDDADKAEVSEFTYVGRHTDSDSELHVILLSRGITIVDDMEVVGGGVQRIDTPLVDRGEEWRYLKGTEAPPAGWNNRVHDDSGWLTGDTSIGYGDGDDETELLDMRDGYVTIFARKTFNIADPDDIDELVLNVLVDDGFICYLNGTQVASYNASNSNFDSESTGTVGDWDEVDRDISSFKNLLRAGSNTLAFSVHNAGLTSSDLTFNPSLIDRTTNVVGGADQLNNGHFNSNANGWMIEGNHIRSGRTTTNPIAGAGSLKIVASGRGDNKVNRIETTNSGIGVLDDNEEVSVSLKTRWVIGSPTILTHGYRHGMAKSHRMAIPEDLGTPGRVNSVTLRQNARTGGNLGPIFTDLEQTPAVPAPDEDVTVRVRITDSDGVAGNTVRVRHAANTASSSPASITMTSVGNGYYEATIPGRANRQRTVFHFTAEDTEGNDSRYPRDVTLRTHPLLLNANSTSINDQDYFIYRHDTREPTTPYHNYRFWLSQYHEDAINSRRRLSNDLMPGSFIFGGDTIYHRANYRFSGSPFARGGWGGSARVSFQRGNPLHEQIRKLNLDEHHGNGKVARERISHYLIRHQNQGGATVPYNDVLTMVRWQVNDRNTEDLEYMWVPDTQFVGLWYPDDDRGAFFEIDDRFVINDSGGRSGNTNARMLYPPNSRGSDGDGANKENYRWFFGLRMANGDDDYSELIRLGELMDPAATSNSEFDQRVFEEMNVEEMLRIWAVRLNTDDWDHWGANRGKNSYLWRPAIDGRWNTFAWDMELTYGNTGSFHIPSNPNSALSPGGFAEVNRMLGRPKIQRMYYSILDEMVNGNDAWFDGDYLSNYAQRVSDIGMSNTEIAMPGGFIDQRAASIRDRISTVVYPSVRLRITTNNGNAFSTDGLSVNLAGEAPVEICDFLVVVNDDDSTVYRASATSIRNWRLDDVAIQPGVNDVTLFGLDLGGDVIDEDTIRITSTVAVGPTPTLTSLTPDTAGTGDEITITGLDFAAGLRVFFDGVESPNVTVVSAVEALAEVPAGSDSVDVTARNIGTEDSNALTFTYPVQFIRGDVNRDGRVDLSDGITGLIHLFQGGSIDCDEAADADDDGAKTLTDSIYILNFLFKSGPQPPAPYPAAGADNDADALGCDA